MLYKAQTWRYKQKEVAPVRAQNYFRAEDIPGKGWGGQHGKGGGESDSWEASLKTTGLWNQQNS